MDEWFREVRECAERGVWSRGVEIARAGRVERLASDGESASLRIRAAQGETRHPRVTLEFTALGWDCDCESAEDPCEHVAAAAIAWRRAAREGAELPGPAADAARPLRYELEAGPDGLRLLRFATAPTSGESDTPITSSLRALVRGRVAGPAVDADEGDWAIEELLGERHGDPIARGVLPGLLRALRGRPLRVGGRAVEIAADPLRAVLRVEDAPGGFRATLRRAAQRAEILAPGIALRGDALHAIDEGSLSGRERERFSRGEFFPDDHAERLAGELLPELEGRVVLDIRSQRLPRGSVRERPRVVLRAESVKSVDLGLAVRADIVYGDPVRARLEGRPLALQSLGGALPIRDLAEESRLARRIQSELQLPVGARLELLGEEALETAARLRGAEGSEDWDITGDGYREVFPAPPLHFELGEAEAADPSFRSGDQRVPADAVVRAWEAGSSFLALESGGWAAVPAPWLDAHGRILGAFLEARARAGDGDTARPARRAEPLPLLVALEWDLLCEANGLTVPPRGERLRALADPAASPPALPTDLRASLRDYQREGVAWLGARRDAGLGALLADDMGLGKTLQVLCVLRGRALVVAPTSVLTNWRDEAARFRPALSLCLYHGAGRRLDPEADVTLTSYALLRRDLEVLRDVSWDVVVLDEAQAIKNADSQVARAAFALPATWRVSLTGTPVENRLEELWSQLHFLNPLHLGTAASFARRYARPIGAGEVGVADTLRQRIRPVLLRRTKAEVAPELPPRTDLVVRVPLDEEERAVYDSLRAATRKELVDRLGRGALRPLAALEALLRLRQTACHRGLVPGQSATRSSKVETLVEHVETAVAEGHKALIFSQWTGLLDRIEKPLRDAGLDALRLDGSTRDRAAVVDAFQSETGPPVFLISLRAGGTGLNLTAADHVFLVDPWWNPAVEEQAADRAHRIGQDKPVFVHRLVAADTVEERMLALQERKREAAQSALAGASGATLQAEEILELLE